MSLTFKTRDNITERQKDLLNRWAVLEGKRNGDEGSTHKQPPRNEMQKPVVILPDKCVKCRRPVDRMVFKDERAICGPCRTQWNLW